MTIANSKVSVLIALFVAALLLEAPLPATAGDEMTTDPEQIARGAEAWGNNCGRCHNFREPRELTDDEWEVSVMHMRKVANLPGEVARDIAAFLKTNN